MLSNDRFFNRFGEKMAKVVFFCRIKKKSMLDSFEYYKQDIDALRALGHEVSICNSFFKIPLKFDVMFIWWWTYALWPVLICKLFRKPSIITGTFNFRFPKKIEKNDYFRRPFYQRFLIKKATTLCSLNLFVNQLELEECTKYFKLNNVGLYPHVIHNDYLNEPTRNNNNWLLNISWSEKKNLIRKGIPELLKAVKILKNQNIEVILNLAGYKGDGIDFLFNMVNQLDINKNVNYIGTINRHDKIQILKSSSIYVQPSHYEGFGLAVAEAMGCGACIITCDVGAIKSVVGDAGIYVPPGSPNELAEAIKKVINDDSLRFALQKKAYQRASEYFSFTTKLDNLKNHLKNLKII